MKFLFLLSLITYFVPFTIEEGPKNFLLQNPFKDRIYLNGIPVYLSNYQPLYFESKNIQQKFPYLYLGYFSDSLLKPSLSPFSIKKGEISWIGAVFKSPISKKDNQVVFLFSNKRETEFNYSQILSSLKIEGNMKAELSYANIRGKYCFSFFGNSKTIAVKIARGDFWDGELSFKPWEIIGIRLQSEGTIKHLTLTNENFAIGVDLEGKNLTPRGALLINRGKIHVALGYGKNLFNGRIEESLHSFIWIGDPRLWLGIEGKLGKKGIFTRDSDTLISSRYAMSIIGVSQSDYVDGYVLYSYPSTKPFKLGIFKRLQFKNGELEIEPGFNLQASPIEQKLTGKFYLILTLFKAVEFRGGYEYPATGMYFGAGVNLLD